jgi:hypothetical protein
VLGEKSGSAKHMRDGVTEDGITENAITLFFGRTGRWHNWKMLLPENTITRKCDNLT